jgi:hypothetical protein
MNTEVATFCDLASVQLSLYPAVYGCSISHSIVRNGAILFKIDGLRGRCIGINGLIEG